MYTHTPNQETTTTHLNSTLKPAGAATAIMETHPNNGDGKVDLHQLATWKEQAPNKLPPSRPAEPGGRKFANAIHSMDLHALESKN
jgi:hypothetical protein